MFVSVTTPRRWGALAFTLVLLGCAREPTPALADAAPAQAAPAPAASTTKAPARPPTTIPAGFERLEAVTPSGTTTFAVEVMADEAGRAKGMMFRKSMAPDRGMLFDFRRPQEVAFWMKNTLIPLDIIFIRPDGRVLSIAAQATPLSLEPIPSGGEILGVLEIAGGRAGELGIKPGDKVSHRIFKGE